VLGASLSGWVQCRRSSQRGNRAGAGVELGQEQRELRAGEFAYCHNGRLFGVFVVAIEVGHKLVERLQFAQMALIHAHLFVAGAVSSGNTVPFFAAFFSTLFLCGLQSPLVILLFAQCVSVRLISAILLILTVSLVAAFLAAAIFQDDVGEIQANRSDEYAGNERREGGEFVPVILALCCAKFGRQLPQLCGHRRRRLTRGCYSSILRKWSVVIVRTLRIHASQ
jgi:hypothetical protein